MRAAYITKTGPASEIIIGELPTPDRREPKFGSASMSPA